MGYSATRVQGDTILIPHSNADKFIELIQPKEERIGHISWCMTVEEYRKAHGGDTVKMAREMLEDFGFIVGTVTDKSGSYIALETWGGDKIGSSWDDVWEVLAQVVYKELDDYQWILVGEDDQMWGERLNNGKNTKHEVGMILLGKS